PKLPPNSAITYALAAFTVWLSLAAVFAFHPENAIPKWEEIIKILAMTFVTMCIVQSRERIHWLVWVIVVSIGIYGVKGGIFAILTGGTYRIYGPPGTFIEENNALALALIVLLPLMQYLRTISTNRWIRYGLTTGMGLTIISILASYSRGALLGLTAMLAFFLLKSKHRFVTMILVAGALGAGFMMLPEEWYTRMHTIEHYEKDDSAQGRLDAWTFAYRLALDHPFVGGGQLVGGDSQLFMRYVPQAMHARAAHSIYFEVLGETGFVGLGLFLFLLIASYRAASNVILLSRDRYDLAWARSLAAMIQVSIVGYAVTGAFLSLGFFDLYYVLVALIAVTQLVVKREVAKLGGGETVQKIGAPIHRPAHALLGAETAFSRTASPDPSPPRLVGP
ncbi:MAG: putative O-glycosylation ligase, exosortase A system-associated, partial [Alphaproteobacteria bacterium]